MPSTRRILAQRDVQALVLLLLLGAVLRALLVYSWRPAMLGFADSFPYLSSSGGHFFGDPLRAPGYPIFLWLVRGLDRNLTSTVVVQHGLGLLTAVIAFAAVRRLTPVRWLALLPAGVLALHGTQIWLEHAILTEALSTLLYVVALAAAICAADDRLGSRPQVGWGIGAGLALGFATMVRPPSLALVAVFGILLLLLAPGPWRRRLRIAASVVVPAIVVIVGALAWAHQQTGVWSLSESSDLTIYGRVAPWVQCSHFTPPKGTRSLCPTQPVRDRLGPEVWLYDLKTSPLTKLYGPLYTRDRPADARAHVSAFVRAAILHQPGAYLAAVSRDLRRVVDPGVHENPNPAVANRGWPPGPAELQPLLLSASNERLTYPTIAKLYATSGASHHAMGFERFYERHTRLTGAPMLVLLLLALLSPFVQPPGRLRLGAALFSGAAFTIILVPSLTLGYGWRYVVPTLSLFTASAALALPQLARLAGARRATSERT